MKRLRDFLAWMDKDIGQDGFASVNTVAGLLPFVPMALILPPLIYFDFTDPVRNWIVGAGVVPTTILMGIWVWRIFLAGRREWRKARQGRRS